MISADRARRFLWELDDVEITFPENDQFIDQLVDELFREWAHNNVRGKKGFQPKTSSVPKEEDEDSGDVFPWDFTPDAAQAWIDDNGPAIRSIVDGKPNDVARQVLDQLDAFSETQGEIYRGMVVPPSVLTTYQPGSTIDIPPSSFSPSRDYATEFTGFGAGPAGEVGVMLRVAPGARGINLANYVGDKYLRDIGDPEEVVTGGRFRVRSQTSGQYYTIVDIEQTATWKRP